MGFNQSPDGILLFKKRTCILNDLELKHVILEEYHKSYFNIHPGFSKMHHNLNGTSGGLE